MKPLSSLVTFPMVIACLSAAPLTGCASVVIDGGGKGGVDTAGENSSPESTPGQSPAPDHGGLKPALRDELYASSATSLYRWNVPSYDILKVGDFDCLDQPSSGSTADEGMHDIAINQDGYMFGVAKVHWDSSPFTESHVIVAIDGKTAHCEPVFIIDNDQFPDLGIPQLRGLSFVPKGTTHANSESLVALEIYGTFMEIDLAHKKTTVLGNLNGAGTGSWATKGADIASVPGGETYVTAKDFNKDGDDRLAVIEPTSGAIAAEVGTIGPETFAGIAYVNGSLHGFSAEGHMYFIEAETAHTTQLTVNGEPKGIAFTGAAAAPTMK